MSKIDHSRYEGHTAGNWLNPCTNQCEVVDDDGRLIATAHARPGYLSDEEWKERLANARLIADAATLLQQNKDLVGQNEEFKDLVSRQARYIIELESRLSKAGEKNSK